MVLVFSDQAREDTKELMKLRQAELKAQLNTRAAQEIQKLKKDGMIAPSASKFYPNNPQGQHLPPNEEEDCGLEMIARYMVFGPEKANTLKTSTST